MRYLFLLYVPEPPPGVEVPAAEREAEMERYSTFTRAVREGGQFQAGEALEPTTTATSVRVRDGRTLVTDGPFAETKEALAGFYLLDCSDLDQAVELAARIPAAEHGSIEIRPILEFAPDGRPVMASGA